MFSSSLSEWPMFLQPDLNRRSIGCNGKWHWTRMSTWGRSDKSCAHQHRQREGRHHRSAEFSPSILLCSVRMRHFLFVRVLRRYEISTVTDGPIYLMKLADGWSILTGMSQPRANWEDSPRILPYVDERITGISPVLKSVRDNDRFDTWMQQVPCSAFLKHQRQTRAMSSHCLLVHQIIWALSTAFIQMSGFLSPESLHWRMVMTMKIVPGVLLI